jgi:hypothetical protein
MGFRDRGIRAHASTPTSDANLDEAYAIGAIFALLE